MSLVNASSHPFGCSPDGWRLRRSPAVDSPPGRILCSVGHKIWIGFTVEEAGFVATKDKKMTDLDTGLSRNDLRTAPPDPDMRFPVPPHRQSPGSGMRQRPYTPPP